MLSFIGGLLGALFGGVISYAIHQSQIKSQFQLAALDRRLDAHQNAYTLVLTLRNNLHNPNSDERDAAVEKCQDWWNKHCLFLSKKARSAFWYAYITTWDLDGQDKEASKEAYEAIKEAQRSLVAGVELPTLDGEFEKLESKNKGKK